MKKGVEGEEDAYSYYGVCVVGMVGWMLESEVRHIKSRKKKNIYRRTTEHALKGIKTLPFQL